RLRDDAVRQPRRRRAQPAADHGVEELGDGGRGHDMSETSGEEARGGAQAEPKAAGAAPGAVRPFLLTEGRVVAAGAELPMETQVVATTEGLHQLGALAFERRAIVEACGTPLSLAELAVRLGLHLNVVRVLAGDLRAGRF